MKPNNGISPAIVIATLFVASVMPVHAQDYPSRSITVIVPFPAGGASDVVARIVTNQMSKTLGQSIIIENVSGAGGTIGSARAAAAAPDGYTLLAAAMGSHVAAPVLTPNRSISTPNFCATVSMTLASCVPFAAARCRSPLNSPPPPPAIRYGTSSGECALLSLIPLPHRTSE